MAAGVSLLALAAAFAAVVFARATVTTMQETAKRELRAYVFPTVIRLHDFGPGGDPKAAITIQNLGPTPARNVTATAGLLYASRTIEAVFPVIPLPAQISKMTLGPDREINLRHGAGTPLTAAEHANIVAGTHALYLIGSIKYVDEFNEDRFTDFRLFFSAANVAAGDGAMSVCTDGNDYR